jgi:hypothetical protein
MLLKRQCQKKYFDKTKDALRIKIQVNSPKPRYINLVDVLRKEGFINSLLIHLE